MGHRRKLIKIIQIKTRILSFLCLAQSLETRPQKPSPSFSPGLYKEGMGKEEGNSNAVAKAHTNASQGRSSICVPTAQQAEQQQPEYRPLLCHLHESYFSHHGVKAAQPSSTCDKLQSPCHLEPKLSLSLHCPDTVGQALHYMLTVPPPYLGVLS